MTDSSARLETLLASLRADDGAPRTRLRIHRIEALAARAAKTGGAVRAVLEQRLQQLLAEPDATGPRAPSQHGAAPLPASGMAALAGLLAELRAGDRRLLPDAASHSSGAASDPEPDGIAARGFTPLPALQAARQTWARLRMDEHLRHVMAEVPDDAGPMHSTVLVHRAIAVMHEAAPGYLQHFLGHADALAALERISPAPASTPAPRAPRPPRPPSAASTSGPGKVPRPRSRGRRRPG